VRVYDLLKRGDAMTPVELSLELGISIQSIYRHLRSLKKSRMLGKIGKKYFII